jgi:glycerate-2-kinase
LGIALKGANIYGIAADTDGIDGSEDNAGAVWLPEFAKRPEAQVLLEKHDSYGFFQGVDGLVMTGPTHTNVNDYRAILVA